jgi:hypothetical protein
MQTYQQVAQACIAGLHKIRHADHVLSMVTETMLHSLKSVVIQIEIHGFIQSFSLGLGELGCIRNSVSPVLGDAHGAEVLLQQPLAHLA